MMPVRRNQNWLPSIFNDTATTEIYTLSLHDALPIYLMPFCYLIYLILIVFQTNLKRILQRLASSSQSWLMILKVPISDVFSTCTPMQRHSS